MKNISNFLKITLIIVLIANNYFILFGSTSSVVAQTSFIQNIVRNSEYSTTTQIDENTFEQVVSLERQNFFHEGNWKKIDNSIIEIKHDQYAYRNLANDFNIYIGKNITDGIRIEKDNKYLDIKLKRDILNEISPIFKDNTIVFKDVFDGNDWEITISPSGVKNEIVINASEYILPEYKFELETKESNQINISDSGRISLIDGANSSLEFDENIVVDNNYRSSKPLYNTYQKLAHKQELSLSVDNDIIMDSNTTFPLRLDPSVSFNSNADTFVTPSSLNTANGGRRFMPIGSYTDYTIAGNPKFNTSRALLNFGNITLPDNAILNQMLLEVYHYGTNTNHDNMYVSLINDSWSESTIWPGPSYSGNYGNFSFPNYNSSSIAVLRQILLDNSIIHNLKNINNGILLRNHDEAKPGVVICSKEIPSGPCHNNMHPQIKIEYTLNQKPNPPALGYPNDGWELGPKSNTLPNVLCSTTGTNMGCKIDFEVTTLDPDLSFPLNTEIEIQNLYTDEINKYSYSQNNNGKINANINVLDGYWKWRARTTDAYGSTGDWSVVKNFIVDSTSPTLPLLDSLPTYSAGNQINLNSSIITDNLIGETKYMFEVSTTDNFDQIINSSGWVDSNNFSFGQLDDDIKYYYRVRGKDKLDNLTAYSNIVNSIQDATFPQINNLKLSSNLLSPINQDDQYDELIINYEVIDLNYDYSKIEIYDAISQRLVFEYISNDNDIEYIFDGTNNDGGYLEDGAYSLLISAVDLAGNITTNEEHILMVDNDAPNINISFPQTGIWINSDEYILKGIVEKNSEFYYSYQNEMKLIDYDESTGIFELEVEIKDVVNIYNFFAIDTFGNKQNEQIYIYKDINQPNIEIIHPKSINNFQDLIIELDINDYGNAEYISGINLDSITMTIEDSKGNIINIIENSKILLGNNQPEILCDEYILIGLATSDKCTYKLIIDGDIIGDGEYNLYISLEDTAGNNSTNDHYSFIIDRNAIFEVTSPISYSNFNKSTITITGHAEVDSNLVISNNSNDIELLINENQSSHKFIISNCQYIDEYANTICDWELKEYKLNYSMDQGEKVLNDLQYILTDRVGNVKNIYHQYLVDLYAIELGIDSKSPYISPNGDNIQDDIEFINLHTNAELHNWQIEITNIDQKVVKTINGGSSLPVNIFWNGTDESGNYVIDGDYQYSLAVITTDNVKFSTLPKKIFVRTLLDKSIYITSPDNNHITNRGMVLVQGQGAPNIEIIICINTLGLSENCDRTIVTHTNEFGGFATLIPLIRLDTYPQTHHDIYAFGKDKFGNYTDISNNVRITQDVIDPFISIAALPVYSGVNNNDAYMDLYNKIVSGEEIIQEDILQLKTIVFRSTVSQNTKYVEHAYVKYTNLDKLQSLENFEQIGYINNQNRTNLFQQVSLGDIDNCDLIECTWDFYYPVPPLAGGIYEILFTGAKGDYKQNLSTSITIDSNIPTAPMIIDINKQINDKSIKLPKYANKYYSNSNNIDVRGIADPKVEIILYEDDLDKELCKTTSNNIGIFYCEIDFANILGQDYNGEIKITTSTQTAAGKVSNPIKDEIIFDFINPFLQVESSKYWVQSGDKINISLNSDEELSISYIENLQLLKQLLNISNSKKQGIVVHTISGNQKEGIYKLFIYAQDLAENKALVIIDLFVDNTAPDNTMILKYSHTDQSKVWGKYNGIYAYSDVPAQGRLTPEYSMRGNTLLIHGYVEKNSTVNLYVDGVLYQKIISNNNCVQKYDDKYSDNNDIIVKFGEHCLWKAIVIFSQEKGYLIRTSVADKSENISNYGENVIVYYDKTVPNKPFINKLY
jgi:flagellar hook assembly protein FlgD